MTTTTLLGIKINFVDTIESGAMGDYNTETKLIRINLGHKDYAGNTGAVILHELTHAIDYWYQSEHGETLSRKYSSRLAKTELKDWVDKIQGQLFVYDEYLAYWLGQDLSVYQDYLSCYSIEAAAEYLESYMDANLPKLDPILDAPKRGVINFAALMAANANK